MEKEENKKLWQIKKGLGYLRKIFDTWERFGTLLKISNILEIFRSVPNLS